MRRVVVAISVIFGLSAVVAHSVHSQSEPKAKAPGADRSADEAAIRANIAEFA